MQRILVWITAAALLAGQFPKLNAGAQGDLPPESESGAVVCVPGVYLVLPDDCRPLGPSAYMTDLARKGLTSPPRPLPATPPDPALAQLPFKYFHLDDQSTVSVYSAPGDTGAGGLSFPPGFVYVSYTDRMDTGAGIYYLMQNGGWIPGKGNRISEISAFQGLAFTSAPRNSFGWAFEQIPVKTAPGYNTANTYEQIMPFQVVQIYDTQN